MKLKALATKLSQIYFRYKFKNKAIFPKSVIFGRNTRIVLLNGSTKSDIRIADNCYIYGTLKSESNGKIIIDKNVHIGPRTQVGSVSSIHIKEFSMISTDIVIMDNNNHPVNPSDRKTINSCKSNFQYKKWKYSISENIVIGENTWLGRNSVILKGVELGCNSIVASNSVVTKSYGENLILAGNPAKVVKENIDEEKSLLC